MLAATFAWERHVKNILMYTLYSTKNKHALYGRNKGWGMALQVVLYVRLYLSRTDSVEFCIDIFKFISCTTHDVIQDTEKESEGKEMK